MRWSDSSRRRVAVALVSLGVVALAGATWLTFDEPAPRAHGLLYYGAQAAVVMTVGVLGLRVVQVRSRHPIGWTLCALAGVSGTSALAESWAYEGLVRHWAGRPGAVAADAFASGSWVAGFAALALLLLYFPNGRVPSEIWRAVPYVLAFASVGAWFGASVKPGRQGDPFASVTNPVGIEWTGHLPGKALIAACFATTLVCLVAAAVSVRLRMRRADGDERAQLFWLAYAAVLAPAALVGCLIGQAVTGTSIVGDLVLPIALVLIPASMGLAVLRYRLYDIEYLVGRTILYLGSTAVLLGVFVAAELGLGVALGRSSQFVVAAATLGSVAVARPVHRRIQQWVNRRFDRDVAEAVALLAEFEKLVRAGRAEPGQIDVALSQALRDPAAELLVWMPKQERFVSCRGTPTAAPGGAHVVDVHRGDGVPARLVMSPSLAHRQRLVAAVLEQAGLGIELARLAVENALQREEVEASRARIVEATNRERLRLERDLHDGAQQRLVALGVRIRRLQRGVSDELATELDAAVNQIGETILDLRRLASGVRPARLDDGLAPALEDLARSTPLPVRLEVEAARLPAAVEASAYYVACEAVTNAVKHASASHIDIAVTRDGAHLRVRVTDDGIGGANPLPRSGLTGLADRVSAVGGALSVTSLGGHGTIVEAELPCGS